MTLIVKDLVADIIGVPTSIVLIIWLRDFKDVIEKVAKILNVPVGIFS